MSGKEFELKADFTDYGLGNCDNDCGATAEVIYRPKDTADVKFVCRKCYKEMIKVRRKAISQALVGAYTHGIDVEINRLEKELEEIDLDS